jgi:hypothetical protein
VLQRQLQKLQAPRNLISFTEFTFPRYEPAALHHQIAEQLERVERGEIDRLMLNVPPRHGKSELASRRFPAWYLGKHPQKHFISASASFSLAEEYGRDVRNLVRSDDYAQVFPDVHLAEDSQSRGKWNTEQGGSYFACGIGGQLYGRGAHCLLIDDPFSSMADARSEHVRKELHDVGMGAWGVVGFALLDKPQREAKGERSHGPHNQRHPRPDRRRNPHPHSFRRCIGGCSGPQLIPGVHLAGDERLPLQLAGVLT